MFYFSMNKNLLWTIRSTVKQFRISGVQSELVKNKGTDRKRKTGAA